MSLEALKDPLVPHMNQKVRITGKNSDPNQVIEGIVTIPPGLSWEEIDGETIFVVSVGVYDHGYFYFLPDKRKWIGLKSRYVRRGFHEKLVLSSYPIKLEII